MKTFSMLTLNLMATMPGRPRKERLGQIADYLNALPEPVDVLLLQEATAGIIAGNAFKILQGKLNESYGYFSASCSQWWLRPFYQIRVGVMSRLPFAGFSYTNLNSKADTWLEKVLWRKRPIIEAQIDTGQGIVNVYAVHLGNLDPINDTIKLLNYCRINSIIGGDFNFELNSPEFKLMAISRDAAISPPDYIFYGPGFELIANNLFFNGANGPVISDHFGLWAKFEVN